MVLVTDGVTNAGIVDPVEFHKLMKSHDIRVFGFLLGNSANWPLMRTICESSGGFYAGVSNDDDLVGQILLAKSKVAYEALHDGPPLRYNAELALWLISRYDGVRADARAHGQLSSAESVV